ncbi:TonB-dependent receptor [Tellurirhabdus bombi]|uniref:TonB-dependent receptor n=1 Tax=Tellurirhabdus bombi TaxID=2907205 RepID=UPI001F1D3A47|nr:TonB-dependent receptor [Tellurirhabdus bombi]
MRLFPFFLCTLFAALVTYTAKAQQRVTLSGTIFRADTTLPLPGASIQVIGVGAGTTTDETGHFSLTLPSGSHDLDITSVGFRRLRHHVVVMNNKTITLRLIPQTFDLEELQVRKRTEDENVRSVTMGLIQLNIQQLKKMPVVLGEPDILKAITLQAGVSTAGEGTGGFNVRGGRTDQNLVLLDGAPLFNTSHLLGFYSNINSDAVQDVELYKGSFQAQYGGRVSSLMLINTKAGNRDRWQYAGGVGLLSSRFVADGPIGKKVTLLVGGRVAYPNWILKSFPEGSTAKSSRAFFYDGNLKLQFRPNATNTFSLTAYRSQDSFKFPGDTLYGWQSNIVSGQWSSLLKKSLLLNVQLLHSDYSYQVDGEREGYTFQLRSGIQQQEVKADLFYTLNDKHKIQGGITGILYGVQKGDIQPSGNQSSVNPKTLQPENGRELGIYLQTEWTLLPALTAQAGLRYSTFAQIGATQVYRYAEGLPRSPETLVDSTRYGAGQTVQTYGGWEPRLGLRLQLTPRASFKLNYSRMRQCIHLISNTTAITPIDFWKLSDPFVPGQIADQYSAGLFQNLADNSIELALEGYYKNIQNLIEYRNGATLLLNSNLETDLLRARGRAYGLELSIAKNKGKLTGQISYSYARSLVLVQTAYSELQVNNGQWFPSNFDRPHNLYLQARWDLSRNWLFSTNFVYSTGIPATYPDGQYVFNGLPTLDYSRRNADRIPDYHRLDIAFSKDTRKSKNQLRYSIWTLGIYNLYARKNPYSIYFTRSGAQTQAYRLAVFGSLIPSINYSFYF